eukprot:356902-Chlamydomonas_euryale.AAC.9
MVATRKRVLFTVTTNVAKWAGNGCRPRRVGTPQPWVRASAPTCDCHGGEGPGVRVKAGKPSPAHGWGGDDLPPANRGSVARSWPGQGP